MHRSSLPSLMAEPLRVATVFLFHLKEKDYARLELFVANQVRALDLTRRSARYVERVPDDVVREVLDVLSAILE
jgi:mRNA-degrading endonuclease toxin of MazEF toxin-antitoxin module